MYSKTLTLTGTSDNFRVVHNPPIKLDLNKTYVAALLSTEMYYSFPNITPENNKLKYFNGETWTIISIETGSYELTGINNEIQKQMINNGDYNKETNEFYISISANTATLKSIVHIEHRSYKVDFDIENSIASTLGFEQDSNLLYGATESQNIVDIMKINSLLINVDFITGSYVNGKPSSVIYSFFPKAAPGHKIVERPNPSLIFYKVHKSVIDEVNVWITDQDGKPVDLRGEKVTLTIEIREAPNTKQLIKEAIMELKKEDIL